MATINGTALEDTLTGTGGADKINAGAGNDVLDGGAGADKLRGGQGDDTYMIDLVADGAGVALQDTAAEEADEGYDTIVLRGEVLAGTSSEIRLKANIDGIDASLTGMTRLELRGNDLNNQIIGNAADNTIIGGRGDDVLSGGNGNDTYFFRQGAGHDIVTETDGAGIVMFGGGIRTSEISYSRIGTDLFISYGDEGDNVVVQGYFGSVSARIEKVVFHNGTEHNDAYILSNLVNDGLQTLSAGDDYYAGTFGRDVVDASAGNDSVYSGAGNDDLRGGSGNDFLNGDEGNDTYHFGVGDGADLIGDYDGSDTIAFDAGIDPASVTYSILGVDLIIGYGSGGESVTVTQFFADPVFQVERVTFFDGTIHDLAYINAHLQLAVVPLTNGDDVYFGAEEAEAVAGLGGNDQLYSRGGDDTLYGNEGDDTLFGEAGNDLVAGGQGDDTLFGLEGDDTYVLTRGDGDDVIYDNDGADTVMLHAIRSAQINYTQEGQDLLIVYGLWGDTLRIQSFFDLGMQIETVRFDDGTVHDPDYIYAHLVQPGPVQLTEGNDNYDGTASNDIVNGGNGDDGITGGPGDDRLSGGAGSDYLYGDLGDDTLSGEAGYDALYGAEGDDLYLAFAEREVDTIYDWEGTDAIRFTAGAGDVLYLRQGDDLIVSFTAGGSSLVVSAFFGGTPNQIEKFVFADGTVHDAEYVSTHLTDYGSASSADDVLYTSPYGGAVEGFEGADTLIGFAGDDNLVGGASNDTLVGRDGDDLLQGGDDDDVYVIEQGNGTDKIDDVAGSNTVSFAPGVTEGEVGYHDDEMGNLVISYGVAGDHVTLAGFFFGGTIADSVTFANGTVRDMDFVLANLSVSPDWLSQGDDFGSLYTPGGTLYGLGGNDYLSGTEGADILVGGRGNDHLVGADGDDVYRFAAGDGADLVEDYDGFDQLFMTAGVVAAEVTYTTFGLDLVVGYGLGDSVTLSYFFGDDYANIEQISFADGTVHDLDYIRSHLIAGLKPLTELGEHYSGSAQDEAIDGRGGNDTLTGKVGVDTLYGGSGDDFLVGEEGDDTIVGDAGDDLLDGGLDNDLYIFGHLDGSDTIYDLYGNDTIMFDASIETTDVTFTRNEDVLLINYGVPGDQIAVQYFFSDSILQVENIVFSDGTHYTLDDIYDRLPDHGVTALTEGADIFFGTSAKNIIHGLSGDDFIFGGDGDDTIDGGTGSDILNGGNGRDLFSFTDATFSGLDAVDDFYALEDTIDISSLISGYDPLTMSLAAFVRVTEEGGSTVIAADSNGSATFTYFLTVPGVTGLGDAAAMVAAGQLAVSVS
ncbi:MAG TPA: calcium-binding protein [Patescibacteria group bacterium]|nr:calcium-binding protein [Patescibacteria group bacterium]